MVTLAGRATGSMLPPRRQQRTFCSLRGVITSWPHIWFSSRHGGQLSELIEQRLRPDRDVNLRVSTPLRCRQSGPYRISNAVGSREATSKCRAEPEPISGQALPGFLMQVS
jgi:hypothetical protein